MDKFDRAIQQLKKEAMHKAYIPLSARNIIKRTKKQTKIK
jgi:hypothetical protein